MSVRVQASVRIDSAYCREDGTCLPLTVTLDGRRLLLRSGLLSAVRVNVDDLKRAIEVLEATVAPQQAARSDGKETRRG